MTSRRLEKLAQAIKEQVSTTILLHLRDPRVKNVTVTGVEVAPDVRSAKVYVSIMGSEKEQSLCLHGLESARGFLQSKVGDRIQTRYTPILSFVLDDGIKKSFEAARIMSEMEMEESANKSPDETGDQELED
ncbi:MAG: 30S ribosome-binding factor RbfA [Planctomycetaceae bacterium]